MIIDIRNHFKKIQKESNLFSRKEIEEQLKKAVSYFDFRKKLKNVTIEKRK